ncbi:MAG: translation elongation factor Ts [Trueperaceae bacterium]|jgi:elongation factor Ts|nr:translation elongation factor Ts [Truepera sp.]HRN17896.1 translation elongation factor Ts [Trueperaceae bacterium]HRQ09418.1 translation elongation factor Ts [Trueperaceae bacterium]
MAVSTDLIKQLRAMTGAGMLDVKKALEDTDGNLEKAAELLRERGIAKADKKADRAAKEGLVGSYVHHNGKIAVLVEVNCETDFVARNEVFQDLARNLAMHVAMASPAYTRTEDVPEEVVAAEKHALLRQAAEEGKPANVAEKIVEGRLRKYLSEIVLLEQSYIKDDKKTVDEVVKEAAATLGENIQVGRFARIAIGE